MCTEVTGVFELIFFKCMTSLMLWSEFFGESLFDEVLFSKFEVELFYIVFSSV